MKITVETEGGIAFMPGLSRPVSVDLDDLDASMREALCDLVDKAHFFTLPPAPQPLGKARDLQLHSITVTRSDGKSHTVRRHDPLPTDLSAIAIAVRAAARAAARPVR